LEVDYDDDLSLVQTVVITCSGKSQIKVGGSSKTLTVSFYDADGESIGYQSGSWDFTIDDTDASNLLTITSVSDDKVKVKFNGGDEYINKILKVGFTSGSAKAYLDVEILPL